MEMKLASRNAPWNQKKKLSTKKEDFRSGKNISRICLKTHWKSQINLQKKLLKDN